MYVWGIRGIYWVVVSILPVIFLIGLNVTLQIIKTIWRLILTHTQKRDPSLGIRPTSSPPTLCLSVTCRTWRTTRREISTPARCMWPEIQTSAPSATSPKCPKTSYLLPPNPGQHRARVHERQADEPLRGRLAQGHRRHQRCQQKEKIHQKELRKEL